MSPKLHGQVDGFMITARRHGVHCAGSICLYMTFYTFFDISTLKAQTLYDAGLITIVALVSPFSSDRKQAKALFPAGNFAMPVFNSLNLF